MVVIAASCCCAVKHQWYIGKYFVVEQYTYKRTNKRVEMRLIVQVSSSCFVVYSDCFTDIYSPHAPLSIHRTSGTNESLNHYLIMRCLLITVWSHTLGTIQRIDLARFLSVVASCLRHFNSVLFLVLVLNHCTCQQSRVHADLALPARSRVHARGLYIT